MAKKLIIRGGFLFLLLIFLPNKAVLANNHEPCLQNVYEERLPRPSGYITNDGKAGKYDYTGLPDPKDIIHVCVNGQFLKTEVPVQVEKGTSLVPMSAFLNKIQAKINWDKNSSTASANLANKTIQIQVNNTYAKVNGKKVKMDVPARLIKGRVFIPLRFVSEQLDTQVIWNPDTRVIKLLTHPEIAVQILKTYGTQNNTADYNYGNFFKVSDRYLLKNNNYIYLLENRGTQLFIQQFSLSFKKIKEFTINKELAIFGGAHAGDDGNFYIIFGQYNGTESNDIPVYRIVKYNKEWNKVKQLDIKDVHVKQPFDASNLTMDSYNNQLIIHSARLRYKSEDGLNHQSNISFHVNTNEMTLINNVTPFPKNHVSHSFATYVQFDKERIVYADHGDAFPRAIVLQAEENGEITKSIGVLSFPGKIGDNYTGANLGGLETSTNNYLLVGASGPVDNKYFDDEKAKNIFVSIVPKNAESTEETRFKWVTNYAPSQKRLISETHIVKVNDNKYVLLWSEYVSGTEFLYYSVIDGNGNTIAKPKRLEGVPSPGNLQPLLVHNTIIWYNANYYMNQIELIKLRIN